MAKLATPILINFTITPYKSPPKLGVAIAIYFHHSGNIQIETPEWSWAWHLWIFVSEAPLVLLGIFLNKLLRELFPLIGGGFKYFLFSPQPGEMIQIDEQIFQMG